MNTLFEDEVIRALWWNQPFASLMLPPFDKDETRKRYTKVRGRVLICSCKNPYKREDVIKLSGEVRESLIDELLKDTEVLNGMAIGIGDLVDCRRMRKEDEGKCYVTYRSELFVWVFANVQPIEPFPLKGKQGWSILSDEVKKQIKIIAHEAHP